MWSHCAVISNTPNNFASNKVFQTSTYMVRTTVSSCNFVKPCKKSWKKSVVKNIFCLIVSFYKTLYNIKWYINVNINQPFYSKNLPQYVIWGVVENDTMFGTFGKKFFCDAWGVFFTMVEEVFFYAQSIGEP